MNCPSDVNFSHDTGNYYAFKIIAGNIILFTFIWVLL